MWKSKSIKSVGSYDSMFVRLKNRIEVDDILMKKQVDYIIFDFEYVNFMDSSGIGVIIGRYKKIASHGGRVSVINMNSRLKKLFNLSGMNKIINIYDTFEDAINS